MSSIAGRVTGLGLVALHLIFGSAASAQDAAQRIKIVVPFPAGGAADFTARLLAQHMGADGKRTVLVENQAGANGNTSAEFVSRSAPDGATLLISSPGVFTTNRLLYKSSFDPTTGLVPVSLAIISPNLLVAKADFPASSMKELVEFARENPRKVTYASQGKGSTAHLTGALMALTAGVEIVHVPYRGDAPAMNDVVAGHVSIIWNSLGSVLPLIRAGQLKALATGSAERIAELPDVPTAKEAGFTGMESVTWFAVAAPAATPTPIVNGYAQEIAAILSKPEVQSRLAELGLRGRGSSPEELKSFIGSETRKWAEVIEKGGIAAD